MQERLRESSSQVTLLQQRDEERERSTKVLQELESRVQVLVEEGLVRVERSASGTLDLQVVQAVQEVQEVQEGQFTHVCDEIRVKPDLVQMVSLFSDSWR